MHKTIKYLASVCLAVFLLACAKQTEQFSVGTDKLSTIVGTQDGGTIKTSGKPGYLVYGPYIPLKTGVYRLVAKGSLTGNDKPLGTIDVASGKGASVIASKPIIAGESAAGDIVTLDFVVKESPVTDAEFRILVAPQTSGSFTSYVITKIE